MPKQEVSFIEVPVTINYDQNRVIGQLRIDKSQLPPRINWTLAPTALVKDMHIDTDKETGKRVSIVTDYELLEVSIIPDHLLKRFTKDGGEVLE